MLLVTHYALNYAGIIGRGLLVVAESFVAYQCLYRQMVFQQVRNVIGLKSLILSIILSIIGKFFEWCTLKWEHGCCRALTKNIISYKSSMYIKGRIPS